MVNKNGDVTYLKKDDFKINITNHWKSKKSGITYPSAWTITLINPKITLNIKPYISDQEHRHNFAYWEGAVKVTGNNISGSGYVEMAGYTNKKD